MKALLVLALVVGLAVIGWAQMPRMWGNIGVACWGDRHGIGTCITYRTDTGEIVGGPWRPGER
jgi:hypothetical protein